MDLPPLTCALVALRQHTHVAALAHVVTLISSFLNHGLPQLWTLPRAYEANLLSLLPRLIARGLSSDVDPHYWKWQCRLGLESAVKDNNLAMVEWIHDISPTVQPFLPMIEAVRAGNIRLLDWLLKCHPSNVGYSATAFHGAVHMGLLDTVKWLYERYPCSASFLEDDMRGAVINGSADAVDWLYHHPDSPKFKLPVTGAKCFAAAGNLEMVQWLHATRVLHPAQTGQQLEEAARCGHLHVVKWLNERSPLHHSPRAMNFAAAAGHLEMVQWLHANRTEGCTTEAMDVAAANGHREIIKWLHANEVKDVRRKQWAMQQVQATLRSSSGST